MPPPRRLLLAPSVRSQRTPRAWGFGAWVLPQSHVARHPAVAESGQSSLRGHRTKCLYDISPLPHRDCPDSDKFVLSGQGQSPSIRRCPRNKRERRDSSSVSRNSARGGWVTFPLPFRTTLSPGPRPPRPSAAGEEAVIEFGARGPAPWPDMENSSGSENPCSGCSSGCSGTARTLQS